MAENAVETQRRLSEQLETAVAELADLRRQTSEVQRVLKAVE